MAGYSYKLTFGNKVTAPETADTNITLDQNSDTVFTSAKDEKFDMRLHGFSIHKKIYQPNHIEAEVVFTNQKSDSKELPAFSEISSLFKGRLVSVPATDQTRAEKNYYVQEIIPLITTDADDKTKLSVKLNIFSLDKLMTLSKYSKAYVARKLGSGILKIEARNFGYSNASTKTPLIETDITSMQILRYNQAVTIQLANNKTATTYIPSEFIHPYLMQYNESFYDFMARCANRFGEFLFFEDGKLNLGLDTTSTATEINDFNSIMAMDCTDGIFDVENYRRDSAKDNSDAPTGYKLNQSFIKKEKSFPNDVFSETNQFVYNTEAVNDEYLFPLYKDKFTNYEREMNFDGSSNGSDGDKAAAFLIPVTKNLLKNEETMLSSGLTASFVQAAINDFGSKSALVNIDIKRDNDKMNKAHIDSLAKLTEQTDGNKAVQFGSVDSSGWFTLDYYKQIHEPQSKVQQEIICIDMGTNVPDVKLGQKIKVNNLGDTEYIVIQIQQDSEIAWSHKYEQQNNDMTLNKVKTVPQRSLKIYAIPISTITDQEDTESKKYLPPVQAAPIIRKAGPQTAFVTDNGDPKHQGRVRVMYPWQTSSELIKLKEQATITEANKTAAKDKLTKANEELKELEEKWILYVKRFNEIKEFLKLSTSERKNKIPTQKIQEIEKAIENLQNNDEKKKELAEKQDELDYLKDFEIAHNDKVNPEATNQVDKDKYDDNTNPVVVKLKASLDEIQIKIADARRAQQEADSEVNKQEKKDDEINKKIAAVYKTLSSPWIRVATPMATSGGGTYFKPQKGDEVLVDYDNGNIERPYVVGSLFSKNVLDPQEYLGRKNTQGGGNATMAIVSPNGHHITFSDPSGNMDFFSKGIFPGMGMYASLFGTKIKDLNDLKDLCGGIHIGDRYGIYEIDMKSQSRSISIKSPFGTIDLNAFNGITINAPNGDVKIKGKNISLEAGNKITVTSGTNIPNSSDDSVGILMSKAAIKSFVGNLTKTYVTSLVDLTLVRSVIETFARPVDGTLLLKSKKYLKLEAGKGKANVTANRYRKLPDDKQYLTKQFYTIINDHVKVISGEVESFFSVYEQLWNHAKSFHKAYHVIAGRRLKNPIDPNIPKSAFNEKEEDEITVLKEDDFFDKFQPGLKLLLYQVRKDVLPVADAFKKSLQQVYKFTWSAFSDSHLTIEQESVPEDFQYLVKASEQTRDWIKEQLDEWKNKYKNGANLDFLDPTKNQDDPFNENKKKFFKRAAILMFLYYVYEGQEKANAGHIFHKKHYIIIKYEPTKVFADVDLNNDDEWRKLLNDISKESKMGPILQALWDASVQKVIDAEGSIKDTIKCLYDKEVWNDAQGGQILFSESDDATLHFNDNQIEKEILNQEFSNLNDFLKDLG